MTFGEDGSVELTKDEFDKLAKMIHYISYKYTGWSGTEYDDLYSSLWVKAIEVIQGTKKIEPNFIAMCCYNLAHDICRSAKRKVTKVSTDSDYIDTILTDSLINSSDDSTYLDNIIIQELVNLFPKNSKERNYLIYLTLYIGLPIEDHKEKELTFDKVFGKFPMNCRKDLALAKVLGFSDDTSTGYRSAKYLVRDKLRKIYENSNYTK